jgi:amidase
MPIMSLELPDAVAQQMAKAGEQVPADAPGLFAASARANAARHRDWLRTHERRERIRARWAGFFREHDVLLCPVMLTPAFVQDTSEFTTRRIRVNGAERSYMENIEWPALVTMALLPSTVIPVGRTAGGLPVGVQIVGPYLEDRTTLAFARAAERELGGFTPPPGLA